MRSLMLRDMGCRLTDFARTVVVADTSLYIPGFNEQPVSVTNIGVDPNGRTTWRLVPGKPTGGVEPIPYSVTGKLAPSTLSSLTLTTRSLFCAATMIQGPSDAVVHASFPEIEVSLSCALISGTADCVGQVQQPGMTITTSIREPMKPYLVQGGGSDGGSSPAPTPAPTQSGSQSSTGNGNGSSSTTGMTDFGVLIGGVITGIMATFFMV